MKQTDLIERIAERGGMSRREAGKLLGLVRDVVGEALEEGEKVAIADIGTFSIKAMPQRTGPIPGGRTYCAPARNKVVFTASKRLRTRVQASYAEGSAHV